MKFACCNDEYVHIIKAKSIFSVESDKALLSSLLSICVMPQLFIFTQIMLPDLYLNVK